jgi:putative CocE/NonD family hydrolase
LTWAARVETNAVADISGEKLRVIDCKDPSDLLRPLPVLTIDRAFLGKSTDYWRDWCTRPPGDPYWNDALYYDKLKDIRIPIFHESGWYDADGIGTKLNYLQVARSGPAVQKMTVGPWGHTDSAVRSSDTQDYGSAASIDLQRDYLRWFDRWLKGIHNHILDEPLVSLYVMGSNRWERGATYPLPQTRFERLYLGAGGRLTFHAPGTQELADRYDYDPGRGPPPPPPAERGKKTPTPPGGFNFKNSK